MEDPLSTVFDEAMLRARSRARADKIIDHMLKKPNASKTVRYEGIRKVGKDLLDARTGKAGEKKIDVDAWVDSVMERFVRRKFEIVSLKDAPRLESFSHFSKIPEIEIRRVLCQLIAEDSSSSELSRAVGSLVGLAVADGVGHWCEFMDCVDRPGQKETQFDVRNLEFTLPIFNKFNLRAGQWTDDTAMSLCMADSLIDRRKFNGSDMRVRFWTWWTRGYNNAFRNDSTREGSVGLGGNIANSLAAMRTGKVPPPYVLSKTDDSGNGSLMRLAPIPLFYSSPYASDVLLEAARKSSLTTHPGDHASEACAFMGFLIASAVRDRRPHAPYAGGLSMRAWLDESVTKYLKTELPKRGGGGGVHAVKRLLESNEPNSSLERNWNWRSSSLDILSTLKRRQSSPSGTYNGHPVSRGYFGAYSIDGLAVAMHSCYHTTSFSAAVERCVNFLGDADSTGAMVGQIAGAFYGIQSIDVRLVESLLEWDNGEIALRAVLLHVLGERAALARKKGHGDGFEETDPGASTKTADDAVAGGGGAAYSVEPKKSCPHLVSGKMPCAIGNILRGAKSNRCTKCSPPDDVRENWVNLGSGEAYCGRHVKGHMMIHAAETGNLVCASLSDLSVWCYGCQSYLDGFLIKELRPVLDALHFQKFGEHAKLPNMHDDDLPDV